MLFGVMALPDDDRQHILQDRQPLRRTKVTILMDSPTRPGGSQESERIVGKQEVMRSRCIFSNTKSPTHSLKR